MAIEIKNYYADFREIDGYNKPINCFMSLREDGKSTAFWIKKIYRPWKKTGQTALCLVYNAVNLTTAFLQSIQDNIINKFTDDNVRFEYKLSDLDKGIVDVRINGKLFVRFLACTISLQRIKQALLKDVAVIFVDEYIVNPRKGEKYPKGLAFTIEEIYTTYKRERIDKGKPLRMYFCGNPYSLYNPIHMWLKIPTNKCKLGTILVGDNWAFQWHKATPELIAFLKKDNPMLEIDEDYRKYAFDGTPINDLNIKLGKLPANYHMRFIFKHDGQYIAVYQNEYWRDHADKYFCTIINGKDISNRRTAYCFDFAELVNGTALLCREDRNRFAHFKMSMRRRLVAFETIECYYLIEEIYFNL